jgi:hypothetical protein
VIIRYDPANPLSDFRNFLGLVWQHLGLPKPTRRQLAIAYYLQFGPKRKMVQAFRGVGKSWVTAAFVLFCLYNNPALNILVVSASKTRADDFTTFCLRLINEMPELAYLKPREGQRNSKISFDVGPSPASQSPSLKSVGITGQITGSRAHLIVSDDIEVPSNSATQMMREKLSEAIKEFDAILHPEGGEICYLGTPQTEDSVYKKLPKRGYDVRIWPALYPTLAQQSTYGTYMAPDVATDLDKSPKLVGHTTEPTRFTDDDLSERLLSYGRAGFALQFMLDTNLSDVDRYPLKLKDLVIAPLNADLAPERVIWSSLPEYALKDVQVVGLDGDMYYRSVPMPSINYLPYTSKVLAIDPSGRGKDETGWAVLGLCHGLLYLLDAGGYATGYSEETLESLAGTAKKWAVNEVIVEANFGDGMFTRLLTPVLSRTWPCGVEEVKHSIQKEKRLVDTLEPVISSHRLVVNSELIDKDYHSTDKYIGKVDSDRLTYYQLFYQMTRLTRDKGSLAQDDRLDALAIAVAHFTESMARDVQKAVDDHRERLMDQELERFRKNVFKLGSTRPRPKTWIAHSSGR